MSGIALSGIDPLDNEGFKNLYIGALEIQDQERLLTAAFVILGSGRLALTLSELQHLREAWIDWQRGEIRVPEHDPCACRRCCILAEQKWLRQNFQELKQDDKYDDDLKFNDVDKSDVFRKSNSNDLEQNLYSNRFRPWSGLKRTVPFGWSERITAIFIQFFDNVGSYLDLRQKRINDILSEAASNASDISPDGISATALRNTGINFWAQCGLSSKMFRDVVGYKHLHRAEDELKKRSTHNTRLEYNVLSEGEVEPPPVSSGAPDEDYEIVCDPAQRPNEPFDPGNYTSSKRRDRANKHKQKTYTMYNPRGPDLPKSRKHFPEDIEYNVKNLIEYIDNISDKCDELPEIDTCTISDYFEPHDDIEVDVSDFLWEEETSSQSGADKY